MKSKIDHFGGKEQNWKLHLESCVMHSQYCAMNARRHVYSEKQTTKDKLEFLITTMWMSHSLRKPVEQTAGFVHWSALSKSMLTAVVQPEEDSHYPFTFKSCKTSANLLDERG